MIQLKKLLRQLGFYEIFTFFVGQAGCEVMCVVSKRDYGPCLMGICF